MSKKPKPKPKSALDRLARLAIGYYVELSYELRKKHKWSACICVANAHDDNPLGTGRTPEEAARNALRQIEGKG